MLNNIPHQNSDLSANLDNLIHQTKQLLSETMNQSSKEEISLTEKWDKPLHYYLALENIEESQRQVEKLSEEKTVISSSKLINPWAPNN